MLKRKVEDTINEHTLFTHNDVVLVALSGGADSVALLYLLHELKYDCKALHCNFHLRGTESDRDERFVRRLCEDMGVQLMVRHFDTKEYASQKHISIEMAARELRYDWFDECIKEKVGNVVAVAHHNDDNVETFLINLTRGSGLNGLKGMRFKNEYIVRPLLKVARSEIISYMKSNGYDYVTDSTNLQNEFTRNKLRLDIIPLFEKINPSFKTCIAETANRLSEVYSIYNSSIENAIGKVLSEGKINIPELLKQISPQTVLFEILYPLGFNSCQIEDIFLSLSRQSGRKFYSIDYELVKDRDFLIINKLNDSRFEESELVGNIVNTPFGYVEIRDVEKGGDFKINPDRNVAYIDKDKIIGTLKLRKWKNGDSFIPLGMKGRKNISDFLTDLKKSLVDKDRTLLVTDDKNIIWVVGERLDDRYKIVDSTKHITVLSLKKTLV